MREEPIGQNKRDEQLWKVAQKRVAFRRHLYTYLFVNTVLWLIWLWHTGGHSYAYPWPIWPTLGWGAGVLVNYFDAYHDRRSKAVEREYEKLSKRGR